MKKVKSIFLFTIMTFLISAVAAHLFNWHTGIAPNQKRLNVGQTFTVKAGSTVTIGIDQYVLSSSGGVDKSKYVNVTYELYNVTPGNHVDFTVRTNTGGSIGDAVNHPFTNVKAGTYVIRANNNTSYSIALGGSVYN